MKHVFDLRDKDENVSIDVQYRIIGTTLTVTDFWVYVPDEKENLILVEDKKKARELYEKYNGDQLIHNHFEFLPEPYFEHVAS